MTASALLCTAIGAKVAIERTASDSASGSETGGTRSTDGKGTASAVPLGAKKIPGFSP